MIYNVNNLPCSPIFLGFPGENDSRPVSVDASPWLAEFPDGTVSFVYTRHDELTYAVVVNQPGPVVTWKPLKEDLVKGDCSLQIQIKQGDAVKKSCIIACRVGESLDDPSDPPQPPRPTYVEEAIAAAGRAEAAVSHYPQIRDGYWWVWDVENGEWVNTGVKATGEGGDVANAVLYTPQTLTDAQKAQARSNIGAAKLFVVRIASESDPLTADKTFAETYAAAQNGMLVRADLWDMDGDLWLDCTNAEPTQIVFGGGAFGVQMTLVFGSDESLTRTVRQIPTDAVLYTEQTLTDAQQAQARENIGSKPPIYLAWDDTVDPGICEKSATEIALLFADGYDVHLPIQAFRGYDLRLRSAIVVDNALVVEFGDVFIKEDGSLENLTVTVDEQKHVELVRTHVSSAELEISQEIDDWADGKALDAGTAKDVLNQILVEVGDELNSKANASDLARVATTGSYNDLSDKPTIPSLTGYATETWVENKGYQTAQQVQTAIAGKADKTTRIAMTASDTTPTLDPNKMYVFPEMASLAITLATPTDSTIVNEYHFVFDSGSTATVLTLPSSVLQPDGFTVEANMHYEVSILEGAMTAQGWAVSA